MHLHPTNWPSQLSANWNICGPCTLGMWSRFLHIRPSMWRSMIDDSNCRYCQFCNSDRNYHRWFWEWYSFFFIMIILMMILNMVWIVKRQSIFTSYRSFILNLTQIQFHNQKYRSNFENQYEVPLTYEALPKQLAALVPLVNLHNLLILHQILLLILHIHFLLIHLQCYELIQFWSQIFWAVRYRQFRSSSKLLPMKINQQQIHH